MKREEIPVSEARQDMKDIVNRVAYGKERICLTSHNKIMVAIVPIEDLDMIEKLEDLEDFCVAEERAKYISDEGTVSDEEMKKHFGLDVQD